MTSAASDDVLIDDNREARVDWHVLDVQDVAGRQEVDPERGLTTAEVEARRSRYGPNALVEPPQVPQWRKFLNQFTAFMQLMLLGAGLLSFVIEQYSTGVLLIVLTLLNAILGYKQEGKAEAAVSALKEMLQVDARVLRDGEVTSIDAEQIVPGDVVAFESGDLIPADGRIIKAASLEIEEAALTGESQPVPKQTPSVTDPDAPLGDRLDFAYMNSTVTRGTGEMIVTATGGLTEVGRIAGMLAAVDDEKSPLQKQMDELSKQLAWIAGAAMVVVVGIGLARGLELDQLLLLGTSMAVAAIPTGLPTVVTSLLALGTRQMADKGAIVKELGQVETLGTTSAICSDKTGTLTVNQMTARKLLYGGNRYSVSGEGYSSVGIIQHPGGHGDEPLDPILIPMALCTDAVAKDGNLVGDPTEGALVVLAAKGGLDVRETRRAIPRIAEVPFDSEYKFMATFHRLVGDSGDEVVRCYVKGAPDVLFERASQVRLKPDQVIPMAELTDRANEVNAEMAGDGMRVLALAERDFAPDVDLAGDLLPMIEQLTLTGLVGIVDPPRPEAREAIAIAHRAGIEVRMITGDHAVTAAAIGGELGITGRAITGRELDALSDEEFLAQVGELGVFGRVAPEHKVRLVDTLQRSGEVVAMTGDGVNDAPALKKADIGVAMGITGTEVSKQAASMILTDDDFSTIVEAVHLGRVIYDNLLKYVRFQIIALTGIILTYIGSSILDISGGVPLTALQILWVNFAVTAAPAFALAFDTARPGLMDEKPRPRGDKILKRGRVWYIAVLGVVMATATLVVLQFAPGPDAQPEVVTTASTMALVTLSLAHAAAALAGRYERGTSFSPGRLDSKFLLIVGSTLGLSVLVTETGFLQRWIGTVPLTAPQWGTCILAASTVAVVSEVWKFVRRRSDASNTATPSSVEALMPSSRESVGAPA